MRTRYRTVNVDGLNVFFREAGLTDAPALLLLHGFPTSSHRFRELIPTLADRYYAVAPDLPGFGFSDAPDRTDFKYSFDHLADVTDRFTERIPNSRNIFRTRQPPLLAVWGKNDPFFLPAGAKAFTRDIPEAEVHLLDAGHFALESQGPEIAAIIRGFLSRKLSKQLGEAVD